MPGLQAADLAPFSEQRMARVNLWAVALCTVLFLTVAIGSCAALVCLESVVVVYPGMRFGLNKWPVGCRYALFGDDVQADVLVNLTLGHVRALVSQSKQPKTPTCTSYAVTPPMFHAYDMPNPAAQDLWVFMPCRRWGRAQALLCTRQCDSASC